MTTQRIAQASDEANDAPSAPPRGLSGVLAGSGLAAAIGAVSCCILPLVLFSVGVGGAWIGNLTALSPYQPYFIAAAVAFLAVGFWSAYRRPKAECADGSFCASPRSGRLVRGALWVSSLLIVAAIAFNYLAPVLLPA